MTIRCFCMEQSIITILVLYQQKSTDFLRYTNLVTVKEVKNTIIDFFHCQVIQNISCADIKPPSNVYVDMSRLENLEKNRTIKLTWILRKLKFYQNQVERQNECIIPSWTPFRQLCSTRDFQVAIIGYCPVIPQPPTSRHVVYTAMNNCDKSKRA